MTTPAFARSSLSIASILALVLGATVGFGTACTTTTPGSSPDAGTTAPPSGACPARDGLAASASPTVHEGDLQGAETWTAEASPHLVKGDLNVRDGAKLTIAPCAVVQLVEGASVNVAYPLTPNTGELVAVGTADQPIRFESKEGARWGNVFVHAPGTARFAYATFVGGGGGDDASGHATIHARGDGALPKKTILAVDHVTIEGSRGAGIKLDQGAAFADGSRDLVVKSSGTNNPFHPYPLEVGESAVDGIPTGTYAGQNGKDEILIEPEVVSGGGGFQTDTTMHDRGVPYHVGKDRFGNLHVGDGTHDAVLTIEAGVKLLFHKETVLGIEGHDTGASAIRALGTSAAPVVFTSAEPAPKAGDWRGFYFNGLVSAKNRLEHVRIEYTGSDCSCSMVSCSAGVTEYEGAILLGEEPKEMFLVDSVIAHGSGHGVVAGYRGLTLDWKKGNTFEDVAGCPVTLPWNPDTSCPDPRPACK